MNGVTARAIKSNQRKSWCANCSRRLAGRLEE
nr:MAG TPA: peptidase [Caudoviricetes sp.]